MGFVYSMKDSYRAAVEAQTGGKNTVIYDDKGYPSIMVAIPKFYLDDVIDGAPHEVHPAFKVNGVVKDVIYISKYQNVVHGGRAYSLPMQDPQDYVNFNDAMQYCNSKGEGWHLMTNAEWAALALWAKKNGTMPRGNNNYGQDESAPQEKGVETYGGGDPYKTYRVATGSGPASWSHNGTNEGVFDLNGNVHEWVHGLRLINGKIWIIDDNDFTIQNAEGDTTGWTDTGTYIDNTTAGDAQEDGHSVGGSLIFGDTLDNPMYTTDPTSNEHYGYNTTDFEALTAKAEFTVPDILKWLALFPAEASGYLSDNLYVRNYGERLPFRGGGWYRGANAGVFPLYLGYPRSSSGSDVGFRSAFVSL
jgi:formylglycine-generating enzyme